MNKNVAEFTQQNDSSEIEESNAAVATTAILEATTEASRIVETTTLAAIRKMTNAKIDSFGRRQF
jgi:hypothetical protein